ncbi:hypothetical protein JTB14_025213 [Gonioctena quinquepunctata]|nr:hypothetical protein JTB14_025213 [Gonioctena quinquepunctata]
MPSLLVPGHPRATALQLLCALNAAMSIPTNGVENPCTPQHRCGKRRGQHTANYRINCFPNPGHNGDFATRTEGQSNSPLRPLYGSSLILEPEENQNQWRPRINSNVAPAPEMRDLFSENVGLIDKVLLGIAFLKKLFAENIDSGLSPATDEQKPPRARFCQVENSYRNTNVNQSSKLRRTSSRDGESSRLALSNSPEIVVGRDNIHYPELRNMGTECSQIQMQANEEEKFSRICETLANDCERNKIRKEENSCRGMVEDEHERLISLGGLEVQGKKLPRIPVTINGKSVLALLYTGASVNFVRPDVLGNMDLTGLPNSSVV